MAEAALQGPRLGAGHGAGVPGLPLSDIPLRGTLPDGWAPPDLVSSDASSARLLFSVPMERFMLPGTVWAPGIVKLTLIQDRLGKKGHTCCCFSISAVVAHVVYGTTCLC